MDAQNYTGSAMSWSAIWIAIALYGAATLMTFGHFLRHGRTGPKRRIVQGLASFGWPAYWLVFYSPGAIVSFLLSDPLKALYWRAAILFVPFYIYVNWDSDPGYWHAFVFAKAVAWAPFWPAYALARIVVG
jgi:hypothetical protein